MGGAGRATWLTASAGLELVWFGKGALSRGLDGLSHSRCPVEALVAPLPAGPSLTAQGASLKPPFMPRSGHLPMKLYSF